MFLHLLTSRGESPLPRARALLKACDCLPVLIIFVTGRVIAARASSPSLSAPTFSALQLCGIGSYIVTCK